MPVRPPTFRPPVNPAPYDRDRGTARERGYSNRWDRLARRYREANPLCLGCSAVGWTSAARCVDHIVPHRGDETLMWDQNNLQGLCYWHHSVVKQRIELAWVQGHASIDDLKLDSSFAMALTRQLETSRF